MFIPLGKGGRCENGGLFVLAPRRVNRTPNFCVLQCPPKAVSVCSVAKDPRRGWGGFLPQNTRKRPRGRHRRKGARCLVLGAWCGGSEAEPGRAVSTKPPPPPTAYGRTRKNTKTRFAGHERRGGCLSHGRNRGHGAVFVSGFAGFRAFSCSAQQGEAKTSIPFSGFLKRPS